jgi:UDP-glucose 4-epimerase
MKVLVTGGAGFIGSHLCEALLARGDEVRVLDDLSTGSRENVEHLEDDPRFSLTIDTVLDAAVVRELMKGTEIVFHLAAAVGVEYVIHNMLKSIQINIRGTEVVLEEANRGGKPKIVLFSTSEIYGKGASVPMAEQDDRVLGPTVRHRWAYSTTKAVDEILALAYWREKKLPVVILRLFNTCGPRQTGQYGMVVPRFVRQALLGQPITVYGDGQQSRCFLAVDDLVTGVLALSAEPGAVGEIVNLGSSEEVTMEELARRVKAITGSASEIEFVPYNQAYEPGFEDMRRRVPDTTKAQRLIGFAPRRSLDDLVRSVVEYFQK